MKQKTKMLRFLTLFLFSGLCSLSAAWAQSPHAFSYQAVVRNASNQLVANTNIGMQVSILQGAIDGPALYIETHEATTNNNGLVTIEVGNGTTLGNFLLIDWADGPYYIKTEIDLNGYNEYTITGVSQLLSVPYALHAASAASFTGQLNEADPVFLGSPANGISVTDVSNWNTAFGWGNHQGLYKPVSYLPTWSEILYHPFSILGATHNQILRYNEVSGKWVNVTPNFLVTESQDIAEVLDQGNDAGNQKILNVNQQAIGTGNPSPSAALEIQSTTQGFLPPRMSTSQIFSIQNPAEGLVVYNTDNKMLNLFDGENWVDMNGNSALKVGNFYGGGYIFYLDVSGFHGLICNAEDIIQTQWGCNDPDELISGADGIALGTGEQNTIDIVTQCTTPFYAAKLCDDMFFQGYDDWFLPSQDEMLLIYSELHENGIGNFTNTQYWTSTQVSVDQAISIDFETGAVVSELKDNMEITVRAVRAF